VIEFTGGLGLLDRSGKLRSATGKLGGEEVRWVFLEVDGKGRGARGIL